MGNGSPKAKRAVAYGMAVVFAAVGTVFLAAPGGVIVFLQRAFGTAGNAAGPGRRGFAIFGPRRRLYVYGDLLAWNMARRPEEEVFSRLLVHAKLASALVSFGLFAVCRPYLVLLANGIIDGLIGAFVLIWFRRKGSRGTDGPRGDVKDEPEAERRPALPPLVPEKEVSRKALPPHGGGFRDRRRPTSKDDLTRPVSASSRLSPARTP